MTGVASVVRRRWVVAVFGALTVGLIAAFGADPYPFAGDSGLTIIDLQRASSSQRFVEVLEAFEAAAGEAAISNMKITIIRLDYAFPVAYGLFLASLLAYLWTPRQDTERLNGNVLIWVPLVAGICDVIENSLHLSALRNVPPIAGTEIAESLVVTASLLAHTKYGLLIVVLLLFVMGAVRSGRIIQPT